MLNQLKKKKKTNKTMKNNFKLTKNNIGEKVELKGWINKSRRLGDLIFFDIRNGQGLVQAVVSSKCQSYGIANSLRTEFVVSVSGEVVGRKDVNPNIPSGDIEISVQSIEIINEAEVTPMLIKDETDALEPKRLEYRYLDLRRNVNQDMLRKRSLLNKIIRDHFLNIDFIEVETPIITKPTPGGAGEFKVLSDNHEGKYYSLVQSPQIYKQLLMYGGLNKYFQIARCFRDEDSRSDRQLEFTQLDLEMSFVKQEDIRSLINDLLTKLVKEFRGIDIPEINVITYEEAMTKYGSDKPDLRFGNEISDLTKELKDTPVNFIKDGVDQGKEVKAVYFDAELSNGEIKKLEEEIKSQGASGLAWAKFGDEISGSLKTMSEKNVSDIKEKMNITSNGVLLMIIDEKYKALEFIGRVRLSVANKLDIINKDLLAFVWVTEFPLFEKNAEGNIEAMHNPFTSIKEEDKEKFKTLSINDKEELLKISSNAYDIVLNGFEIGGGAIRISDFKEQDKVFELIGISQEEIESNFGWFLEAQKYGVPQHGGIALGLDRLLAVLLNTNSIRDVIAFPKTSHGTDEMMKAPIDLK